MGTPAQEAGKLKTYRATVFLIEIKGYMVTQRITDHFRNRETTDAVVQQLRQLKQESKPCPEGGVHEFSADLEYDVTGETINCTKCGEPES